MSQPTRKVGPPRSHILETEIDEEISLYDPRNEQVVVLNQTASDVWRLSDGECDLEEIVRLLSVAYGVAAEDIRGEVEDTVRSLQGQGLLEMEQD